MLIRMTDIGSQLTALIAVAAVAAGGLLGPDSSVPDDPSPGTALVIDAAAGRDGRELVDPRLRDVDADVRLPRTAAEARTNLRYFDSLGYRVVVTGPDASAAAEAAGVDAVRAPDLSGALRAVAR
jgi:hypothetical protein